MFQKIFFEKLFSMRAGLIPVIMFCIMTYRTFTSGYGVIITGLCAAFLPFFIKIKDTREYEGASKAMLTCVDYSIYLMLFLIGFLYLKCLSIAGELYYPAYVVNPYIKEAFRLTYLCDIIFVSLIVPLGGSLPKNERMLMGIMLANIEIVFMFFANHMLVLAGDRFNLFSTPLYYALPAMMFIYGVVPSIIDVIQTTRKHRKVQRAISKGELNPADDDLYNMGQKMLPNREKKKQEKMQQKAAQEAEANEAADSDFE